MKYILSLHQGATSPRAILFDHNAAGGLIIGLHRGLPVERPAVLEIPALRAAMESTRKRWHNAVERSKGWNNP